MLEKNLRECEEKCQELRVIHLKPHLLIIPEYENDESFKILNIEIFHSNIDTYSLNHRRFVGKPKDKLIYKVNLWDRSPECKHEEVCFDIYTLIGGFEFEVPMEYIMATTKRVKYGRPLVTPFLELDEKLQKRFIEGNGLFNFIR